MVVYFYKMAKIIFCYRLRAYSFINVIVFGKRDGVEFVWLSCWEWHAPVTCREKSPAVTDGDQIHHHHSRTPAPHPANTSPNNGRRNTDDVQTESEENSMERLTNTNGGIPWSITWTAKEYDSGKGKKKNKLCGKTNPGWPSLSEWACVSERSVSGGREGKEWGFEPVRGSRALPRLTGPLTRQ